MILEIATDRRTQLADVTARVCEAVAGATGVVTLFVPHTTAGVAVQAAGDGAAHVAADVETALDGLVDEAAPWLHLDEGDRNPWSHIRAVLTASSLTIPLLDGRPALGDHQAIFLCEFDGPRTRRLHVAVHG
ncbi:MAG: secondary thiamine-phosphate synthase enzyme YjbQ [Actinomycetota bacterium]